MKNFGTKDFCQCLINLGLTLVKNQTSSHHLKYDVPKSHIIRGGRTFMMAQLGQKSYHKNACSRYISELKQLGFTKEEIEKCMP